MSDPSNAEPLLQLVQELADRRKIELPPLDPHPEQQPTYERYLRSLGLDPSKVDRVVEMDRLPPEKRAEIHAQIMLALINQANLSDWELKAIIQMVRMIFSEQRSTGLLRTICSDIVRFSRQSHPALDRPYSIGVFPLRWFNGQSTLFEGTPICLASNGSFDLIEIFCVLFEASRVDSRYAAENTRLAIEQYVRSGSVEKADYLLAKDLVDFGNLGGIGTGLTTAGEQFLLAHELGHVALGHVAETTLRAVPAHPVERGTQGQAPASSQGPHLKTVAVIDPAHVDEHSADIWALLAMLDAVERSGKNEELPLAIAGGSVFLGLAILIEHVSRLRGIDYEDSHPPATARLYLVELCLELTGHHENAFVARRIREFVETVGAAYSGFEMPPVLARDLNRVAASVFGGLGLDLSNAPYITDFQ